MDKRICEMLNDVKVNFDEYETKDLSLKEKKEIKKKVLWEVKRMNKNHRMNGRKKGWKVAGISAAACMAVSVAAVGSNPAAAKTLLSETFQKIIAGTTGTKDGDDLAEIYTKIGEQSVPAKAEGTNSIIESKDSNVKIRVSDIYCDGYVLYYTLVLEANNTDLNENEIDGAITFSDDHKDAAQITVDGEKNEYFISFEKQSDGTYTSVQEYTLYTAENPKKYQNGDVIPFELDIHSVLGFDYDKHVKKGDIMEYMCTKAISGDWKLSFPVVVDTSGNHTEKIGKENNGVEIVSATRTKGALHFVIKEPDFSAKPYNVPYGDPDIGIKGEDGNYLQCLSNYHDIQKDGSTLLYFTCLDNGGENFKLEVTEKNKDAKKIAEISFKVKH